MPETDKTNLQWQPIVVLLVLTLIWGTNMALIKIGAREIPPLLMAGLRSLVASLCLFVWMKNKGIVLFPAKDILIHGIVTGLLFGAEFGLIYVGLGYTLASRTYILVYSAPFFVAFGAHFLLKGDRINLWKMTGLLVAFVGIVVLFIKDLGTMTLGALPGDIMALLAGAVWAATTLYIKKYLAHRTVPLQTLFYQVLFSALPLLLMSVMTEDLASACLTWMSGFSLFFQSIIVAFLSYLVWFELIHRYPVSLLHSFTFFTPVFGVFLSGALILGEMINARLILALLLVSLGTLLVNRSPRRPAS
jgi:drug/metabolite transporter (DMT)-like permease